MDWVSIALVAGVFLVIGYLTASLVATLRRPEPAEEAEVVEIPDPFPEGLDEILRVWRRSSDGVLIPEVRGEAIYNVADLKLEHHADISLALVDLYAWLEQSSYPMPTSPLSTEKSDAPASGSESVPMTKSTRGLGGSPQPVSTSSSEVPSRPSLNPLKPFLDAARRGSPPVTTGEQPMSIAAQIDEILQRKISGTPLERQEVRLIEFPKSGMVILVGKEQYEGVDAVPDKVIREVIEEAVSEWEARMLGDESDDPTQPST
jgi:hypothetical protein